MTKIKITGDSTMDLPASLIEKYRIHLFPLYIILGEDSRRDTVDITPDDIYEYVERTGNLPKTSAASVSDYLEYFTEMRKESDAIIHFSLGSGFSSTHQNACIAASELDNVYVIDPRNLSSGIGLLVLEACEMAEAGKSPEEIVEEINALIPKVETSFVISKLDYLHKGGRCSGVAAFGANLLKIRPIIQVVDGQMIVGKKLRGTYQSCVEAYVKSQLEGRTDIRKKRIFLTHTRCSEATVNIAADTIRALQSFDEIVEATAGCTITTHCGDECLGVLFIRE